MNEILSSQTFLLTLTLAVYLGSMWLYKKVRFALLHPLISFLLLLQGQKKAYQ